MHFRPLLFRRDYWKLFFRRRTGFSLLRSFNLFVFTATLPFLRLFKIYKLPYGPISTFVWVTTRCNKACDFCLHDGQLNKEKPSSDLTFEQFKDMFKNKFLRKNFHVAFYGGEPLLNKDLFKMIGYAKKQGLLVTTTTNGLHLKRRSNELAESPPDLVTVSYYQEELAELQEQLKFIPRSCVKKLNFILSVDTIQNLETALVLAGENQFDILSIDPLSDDKRDHAKIIWAGSEEFLKLKARLEPLARRYGILVKWPETRAELSHSSCRYFWTTVYLNKNGEVAPCSEWKLNDYSKPGLNDWNGAWFVSQRKGLHGGNIQNPYCTDCIYLFDSTMNV
jgi:MoaA/NifB/PqqE/SkfB family radical SAM enzyme